MNKLKIVGEIGGILGAFMVATNTAISGYGFIAFTVSSVSWSWVAWKMKESSLFRMSLAFTAVNLLGVYRWLV
jgi:hypothetical protein